MTRYVVYPTSGRRWVVLREGEQMPMHFPDRDTAIGFARCLASANRPSALTIETASGALEHGWAYDANGRARPLPAARG